MLRVWDVGSATLSVCPLCETQPDSHDHLFFECAVSSQVWLKVRVLCGMDIVPPRLWDIRNFVIPISKGGTVVSILSRLVVAASSYNMARKEL